MKRNDLVPGDLRRQHADEIVKASTIQNLGVSVADASRFLRSADGARYLQQLSAADPQASKVEIYKRAEVQIRSGKEIPQSRVADQALVKIVPAGSQEKSLAYSPYFAEKDAFTEALSHGQRLNDHFALPIKSEAERYDVYQIQPKGRAEVWVSEVAPTAELNGQVTRSGGGTQVLVLDRPKFTEAALVGSIENSQKQVVTLDAPQRGTDAKQATSMRVAERIAAEVGPGRQSQARPGKAPSRNGGRVAERIAADLAEAKRSQRENASRRDRQSVAGRASR